MDSVLGPLGFGVGRRSLLTEEVYAAIKTAIIDGSLKAGQRLREEDLATQLGVSRTPVREALSKLKFQGLVLPLPGGGAVVAKPTKKQANDVYDLRVLIEAYAARKAALIMTETDMASLVSLVAISKVTLEHGEFHRIRALNSQFHEIIYRACGNDRLLQVSELFRDYIGVLRRISLEDRTAVVLSIQEHENILDAIKRRDPELCAQAMTEHIEAARSISLKLLEEEEGNETAEGLPPLALKENAQGVF